MSGWTVPGYTESRTLRSGPDGRVALAVRETTGDPVAVQYLPAGWREDAEFVAAFPEEARRLTAVDAPEVVRLHAFVPGPRGDALVRELVDGITLRELLRQESPTGPEAALAVLKSTLLGLGAVHGVGLVHRACHPGNVLVTADGSVRLTGCGVAPRTAGPGTLAAAGYLAPEQWGGGPAAPAADAYAATVVFFECLTGSRPYVGDSVADLSVQHITAPVPDHRVPEPVRPLVLRGLAKEPAQRPESARDFVAELERRARQAYGADWEEVGRRRLAVLATLLPSRFPSATDPGAAGLGEAAPEEGERPEAERGGPGWRGRRGLLVGAALLLVAGTLTVAAVAGGGEGSPGTAQADDPAGADPTDATPAAGPSEAGVSPSAESSPSGGAARAPGGRAPTRAEAPDDRRPDGPEPDGGTRTTRAPSDGSSAPQADRAPSTEPVTVETLTVRDLKRSGGGETSAVVEVVTDSTAPVDLTVVWRRGGDRDTPGDPDGEPETYRLSGQERYEITAQHTYDGLFCHWHVSVSTDPVGPEGEVHDGASVPLCLP